MDNTLLFILLIVVGLTALIVARVVRHRRYRSDRSIELRSEDTPTKISLEAESSGAEPPDTMFLEIAAVHVPEAAPHTLDLEEETEGDGIAGTPIEQEEGSRDEIHKEGGTGGVETTLVKSIVTPEPISILPAMSPITAKRPPANRGGRPRGNQEVEEKQEVAKRKQRPLKPEVVCWKEARKWLVGIEMPDEYQKYKGLTVTQNSTPLTRDNEGRWLLLQTTGSVSLGWDGAERPIEINVGRQKEPYLLFRLTGQNVNRGRLVRYATVGSFLVIAPAQWQHDEQLSGRAPVSPDPVAIAGYQAHFFSLNRRNGEKISFHASGDESVVIPTCASRFELVGTRLSDASDDIGPLFGVSPPRIRTLEGNSWSSVKTIVVGQEGRGKKRWRTDFSPKPELEEQDLPTELSERCGGWYFIRLYDIENELIESLDFRFANALKDITISPHSTLPGVEGHLPVGVEFLHDTGCVIELITPSAETLSIDHEDTRTSTSIPPDPAWDETRWIFQCEGGLQVEVKILVERVWWAIGKEGVEGPQLKWTDKPLNIPRDFLTATSKHTIWLRLPRPHWTDEIHVGFERWKARAYHANADKPEVIVPLSHFEGVEEIEERGQEHLLKLWIKDDANQDMSAVVAFIPATQSAITGATATLADAGPPLRTPRLRADVRRVRKYLRRLGHKTQDTALREMIREVRGTWSTPVSKAHARPYRIETACVIVLAWEILRAASVKPPGRRKRWLRKLVELSSIHSEAMQRVRENYEMLKHGQTGIPSQMRR